MRDFAVISGWTGEVNLDELPPGRLIVANSYRGQYFVVEEIGRLMRVIAGPFGSPQDASEALLLLEGRSLRNAS